MVSLYWFLTAPQKFAAADQTVNCHDIAGFQDSKMKLLIWLQQQQME